MELFSCCLGHSQRYNGCDVRASNEFTRDGELAGVPLRTQTPVKPSMFMLASTTQSSRLKITTPHKNYSKRREKERLYNNNNNNNNSMNSNAKVADVSVCAIASSCSSR